MATLAERDCDSVTNNKMMATKILNLSKSVKHITKLLNGLLVTQNGTTSTVQNAVSVVPLMCKQIHSSSPRKDLMQFFDSEKNWGENEVKVGRSWRNDELRIKSNEDLHKLWFVLLKERNMLLTMEHESAEKMQLFPSPERIDKVKESMTNLESVVRERNESYFMLETGESGERPGKVVHNALGLKHYYRMREHLIPKSMNKRWRSTHQFYYQGHAVHKFLRLYREKLWNEKRKKMNRDRNHVMHLMRRFPNLDLDAVKEQYPKVDIKKAQEHPNSQGHFVKE